MLRIWTGGGDMTHFEMGVDLEIVDTEIYPLPTMIVFF